MEFLTIGQIVKTVGLRGEVRIIPTTHFRDLRFKSGNHVFLYDEKTDTRIELIIKSRHKNGECEQVIFENYENIETVQNFINKYLQIVKDTSVLKKGMYYYSDLEKCYAYFDNGNLIGKVIKVEEYSSYPTLRIKRESSKDVLVPYVKQFIRDVNIEENKIIINFIEGLI